MTVSTQASQQMLSWTGVEALFAPGFPVKDKADLKVLSRDAAGTDTPLVEGVNYNVTVDGVTQLPTVTPVVMPTPPRTIVFYRNTPTLQPTAFANLGGFSATVHEDKHDRAALWASELRRDFDRSIRVPLGETTATIPPLNVRMNAPFVGFDAAGNFIPVSGVTPTDVPVTPFAKTVLDDPDALTMRATLGIKYFDKAAADAAALGVTALGEPTGDKAAVLAAINTGRTVLLPVGNVYLEDVLAKTGGDVRILGAGTALTRICLKHAVPPSGQGGGLQMTYCGMRFTSMTSLEIMDATFDGGVSVSGVLNLLPLSDVQSALEIRLSRQIKLHRLLFTKIKPVFPYYDYPVTATGVNGNSFLTSASGVNSSEWAAGMTVYGAGVQANTRITSIVGTTVNLSLPLTAPGTAYTFGLPYTNALLSPRLQGGCMFMETCTDYEMIDCGIRYPAFGEGFCVINCNRGEIRRMTSFASDPATVFGSGGQSSVLNAYGPETGNLGVFNSYLRDYLGSAMNVCGFGNIEIAHNKLVGGFVIPVTVPGLARTGTGTNPDLFISNISSFTNLVPGMQVSGTGVQAGTKIASLDVPGGKVNLTLALTAPGTNYTFGAGGADPEDVPFGSNGIDIATELNAFSFTDHPDTVGVNVHDNDITGHVGEGIIIGNNLAPFGTQRFKQVTIVNNNVNRHGGGIRVDSVEGALIADNNIRGIHDFLLYATDHWTAIANGWGITAQNVFGCKILDNKVDAGPAITRAGQSAVGQMGIALIGSFTGSVIAGNEVRGFAASQTAPQATASAAIYVVPDASRNDQETVIVRDNDIYGTPLLPLRVGVATTNRVLKALVEGNTLNDAPLAAANASVNLTNPSPTAGTLFGGGPMPTYQTHPDLGQTGVTGGTLGFFGATSGKVSVVTAANAGTWNFVFPTSAGTAGQPLLSGGGGATAQTYGTVMVPAGGTGLVTGTSGGILGFTAATTLASSVALTANQLILGAGAGATPVPLGSLGTATQVLHGNAAGAPTWGTVTSSDFSGTMPPDKGGTGVANNAANTITFAGGNFSFTLTLSGNTNITFPTSGTAATLAGAEALTNKTIDNSPIGGTTPAAGAFTTLTTTLKSIIKGAAGGAGSEHLLTVQKTGILDNAATAVITVTVPNAQHSASMFLEIAAAMATGTDAGESARTVGGGCAITRTAGVNTVATLSSARDTVIATLPGGGTFTLNFTVSAISGGAGATQTFTINVTCVVTGTITDYSAIISAKLLNHFANGITMAAA